MPVKFLDIDCMALLLSTTRSMLESSNKPGKYKKCIKATVLFKKLNAEYDLNTITETYLWAVDESLLELRPNIDELGKKIIPSSTSFRVHHIQRVSTKGYRFLDNYNNPSIMAKIRNTVELAANTAQIASVITSFCQ